MGLEELLSGWVRGTACKLISNFSIQGRRAGKTRLIEKAVTRKQRLFRDILCHLREECVEQVEVKNSIARNLLLLFPSMCGFCFQFLR